MMYKKALYTPTTTDLNMRNTLKTKKQDRGLK